MKIFLGSIKRLIKNPLNLIFLLIFPMIFTILTVSLKGENFVEEPNISIGVVDLDQSPLSQAVTKQLDLRYTYTSLTDETMSAALTNANVAWVLRIPSGFQQDLLAGRIPTLEGEAISISDVQALASINVEHLIRALSVLTSGAEEADLPALLGQWQALSAVKVTDLPRTIGWADALIWISFHGWVSLLTAFFLVRTLMVDRKQGLPERVGVLPISRRLYLAQCLLAVFLLCELSSGLLIGGVGAALGSIPNLPHLVLLLSVYNLFATGLALGILSLFKSSGVASAIFTMISVLLAMLGGTYWPIEIMPPVMKKIAFFSPNYWLSLGLKHLEAITWAEFWLPVLLLALFALVTFLLGSWRRIERADD